MFTNTVDALASILHNIRVVFLCSYVAVFHMIHL